MRVLGGGAREGIEGEAGVGGVVARGDYVPVM